MQRTEQQIEQSNTHSTTTWKAHWVNYHHSNLHKDRRLISPFFNLFFNISDCNVQMLWEWGETKVQKEGECMSFFSKRTTPQLVDIHHSITETGNDKNARRSFNSWSYTSTLLWGRTINQLWLTSPVVWSTHQWNRKACLAHTFPPMQSPSMLLVQDPWGTATQNFTYSSHSKPQLFINSVRYSSSAVKIPLLLSNAHRLLSR